MKFTTGLPGLMRYPPSEFPPGGDHWQTRVGTDDFQRVARTAETLDVLSGGRVTVTFGVGMARGEFAPLGFPFHERGRVADEYLDVIRTLWTADAPEFHGAYVDFSDVFFEPKTVQRPHPPIWVGGSSMAALRRLFLAEARRVPGFAEREHRFDISMPVTSARFGPAHEELPEVDRPPASTAELVDRIGAMQAAGVTWTSVPRLRPGAARSLDEHLDGLAWAAAEIMPALR